MKYCSYRSLTQAVSPKSNIKNAFETESAHNPELVLRPKKEMRLITDFASKKQAFNGQIEGPADKF
jgi:hypothetical protein